MHERDLKQPDGIASTDQVQPCSLQAIDDRIKAVAPLARQLDLGSAERATLQRAVLGYGERFLDDLLVAKAYVKSDNPGAGLWDYPIQEAGRPIAELLQVIRREVDKPGINPASAGHLGYIPGGGVYPSSLGDYMAAITNRYAGVFFASPGAVQMENLLVRWLADLIGYPSGAGGDLTSGGSIASLSAIVTAREARGVRARDVERAVVYSTHQVHHCIGKALAIAGMREAPVHTIAMDWRYRMDVSDLARRVAEDRKAGLRPFMVVASAGTTDTGAVDPLDDIADRARDHDLWFHVDAAYGGFFRLCPEAPPAMEALKRCDSIVLDPHKSLFLPYGSGALLVRDRDALFRAHQHDANYMQDTRPFRSVPSPADHSPELTRHFRGMRLWLALQLFGVAPFRANLSEKIWLTRYFHAKVRELPYMEAGPDPELSVSLFRYAPPGQDANALNRKVVRLVHADGRIFLTSTTIDGQVWLRLAVLVFRTTKDTIDLALDVLNKAVEAVANGPTGRR